MRNCLTDAMDEIDRSLIRNWHNHKARALKTTILRKAGRNDEALKLIEESLEIDRFNYGCLFEKYIITGDDDTLQLLKTMMRRCANNYDEVALDYCAAGCTCEALKLWSIAIEEGALTR